MNAILHKKNDLPSHRRRIIAKDECFLDLQETLPVIFEAYYEAFQLYEHEVIQTPPTARARGFEASLLNSKMIQSVQNKFPTNSKFGKYKRFILHVNGYVFLFKKLDGKGKPMNIKTNRTQAIACQQTLSLFENDTLASEPIIFFGYKKDKVGNVTDPQLVYIDEDQVRWKITEADLDRLYIQKSVTLGDTIETAVPKLRKQKNDKAVNE